MLAVLLQVAAGGALGAVCRFLTGVVAGRLLGGEFPYGTFASNAFGCLAMGIAFAALTESGVYNSKSAPFLMTGFLGGYTTFSAFSLDFWQLLQDGRTSMALFYATGSVVASIAALAIGIILARQVLS